MEVRAKESVRLAMLGGTIHALRTPTGAGQRKARQKREVEKLKVGVQEREVAQGQKKERLGIRKKGKVKGMKHNNLIALWLLGSR
jgi:hypothetical protein